jgi:uncharacterized protein (TIGR02145 family)
MKTPFSIFLIIISFLALSFTDNNHLASNAKYEKIQIEKPLNGIKIGSQTWSTTNLNVDCFSNGDKIYEAKSYDDWIRVCEAQIPAWCYIENDTVSSIINGKLYNWFAISDSRKLVAKGWHVATDKDWTKLISYLGGEKIAGQKLKSSIGWNEDILSLNSSGFSAYPIGIKGFDGGFYGGKGEAYFWSPSKEKYPHCIRGLHQNSNEITRDIYHSSLGVSVRCVKDK